MTLSVAIPNSCLSDESTKEDKTRKISVIARACAVFGTETIFIYDDGAGRQDRTLLLTVLKYLDTPPFLRRLLFPMSGQLRHAGVLHPLNIPSHAAPSNPKRIRRDDVREGVVQVRRGRKFIDTGIGTLLPYYGRTGAGRRVTVKFKSPHPDLDYKEITRGEAGTYRGCQIRERASLFSLISEWNGRTVITSRKGGVATRAQVERLQARDVPLLVVFGTVDRGVHEMLGGRMGSLQDTVVLNFFPGQSTQTVRLEEALVGSLSVINMWVSRHGA